MNLIKDINKLRKSSIRTIIDKRIKEFSKINKKGNRDWFSELCFCILTANTSAELGLKIQNELGYRGFTDFKDEQELSLRLKKAGYRFYNRRAHFISLANQFKNIKSIISKIKNHDKKREWLIKNIKGLGYKEASHFLRNVGFFDYAILDKHVLNLMKDNKLISSVPKSVNEKQYLEFEKILETISKEININQGELDLYLWYMKTGKVLK